MAENSQTDRLTVFQETSDGVQTVYPLRFALGYLQREDIYVYQGEHGNYLNQIPYTWVDDNSIDVQLPAGEEFWVRRIVNRDDLNYYFASASLHPATIDKAHLQLLMLSQELMDGFGDPDGLGNIKNILDMRGFRIENLGDGRPNTTDAVNMVQFQAVSDQLDRIDTAVAESEAWALMALDEANRAETEADRAQSIADQVVIQPEDALEWKDPLEPVPNRLAVNIAKQPEIPQALANDYILVEVSGTLYKVKVENIINTGGAYDLRGIVTLDDNLSTGVLTDQIDNDTQYPCDTNSYPSPNAQIGHAFTVAQDATQNSITGVAMDWKVGDIMMWSNTGWVILELAVRSWQGKVGDITVELGDISTDVIHLSTDTNADLTSKLADMDAKRVEKSLTSTKALIPFGNETTAGTPDKGGLFFDEDDETLKSGTGTSWITSGGGVPKFTVHNSSFTALRNKAYGLNMADDVVKTVTLTQGLANGSWIAVKPIGWTGNEGVHFFIDSGAEEWEIVGDATTALSRKMRITANVAVYLQKIAGKWSVVDGIGEGDNNLLYSELDARVTAIEDTGVLTYPTPWEVIGTPGNASFIVPAYSNGDETQCRWLDKDTYQIKGIMRTQALLGGGAYIMNLPAGYRTGHTLSAQYLSMGAASADISYCVVSVDNPTQVRISTETAGWFMFDWTIYVKPV